jgi:hypothetical protein
MLVLIEEKHIGFHWLVAIRTMQLIRCTGKLQKEMGLRKSDLSEETPRFSYLGSWYANLTYIDGRKCVVFTNGKTLFNFIATDVSRAEIKELDSLFKALLLCVLSDEGFEPAVIEKIMAEYETVAYAKTNSRSVLASMNDIIFSYKRFIQRVGGVHSYAVPEIIRHLNRMPLKALGFEYPVDVLREMFP